MPGVRPKLSVNLSGPFFDHDPRDGVLHNIGEMLEGVAAEGQRLVREGFAGHEVTGMGREGVIGRVKAESGKRWRYTAVVSQSHVYDWKGGGPKQYRGGKLEGKVHMFARATRAIRAVKVDLAKGLS